LEVIPTPIPPIKPGSSSASKRKRAVSVKSESDYEGPAGEGSHQEGDDDVKEQDKDATIDSVGKGKKPEKKGKSGAFEQQMLGAMKDLNVSSLSNPADKEAKDVCYGPKNEPIREGPSQRSVAGRRHHRGR
jgi:hypothetical protein